MSFHVVTAGPKLMRERSIASSLSLMGRRGRDPKDKGPRKTYMAPTQASRKQKPVC